MRRGSQYLIASVKISPNGGGEDVTGEDVDVDSGMPIAVSPNYKGGASP
jgi:hypothetical protein